VHYFIFFIVSFCCADIEVVCQDRVLGHINKEAFVILRPFMQQGNALNGHVVSAEVCGSWLFVVSLKTYFLAGKFSRLCFPGYLSAGAGGRDAQADGRATRAGADRADVVICAQSCGDAPTPAPSEPTWKRYANDRRSIANDRRPSFPR
jgi:hypothetical protein